MQRRDGAEVRELAPPVLPTPSEATAVATALLANVSRVLLDKPDACRLAVAAVLGGGHVLVEDIPGVGKTLLAKALARSMGGEFGRVQGTADLLPADITGVTTFDAPSGNWVFRPGPVFANVVLFDEVNRATPRAQSALLEAMAEQQVTADGVAHALPDPFVVIATQNPQGDTGTFPLVEGQLDRFAITLTLGLPGRAAERALLFGAGGEHELERVVPVTNPDGLRRARAGLERLHVADVVADYVLDVAEASRQHPQVALGASPRASQLLLRLARASAALAGRDYVTPDDVQAVAPAVLTHRLGLHGARRDHVRHVVDEIMGAVRVPVA